MVREYSKVALLAMLLLLVLMGIGKTEVHGQEQETTTRIVEVKVKLPQKEVDEYKDLEDTPENRQAYKMASLGVMGNVPNGMYEPEREIKETEIEVVKERLKDLGVEVVDIEVQTRKDVADTVVGLIEEWGIELEEAKINPSPVEEDEITRETRKKVTRGGVISREDTKELLGTFNASAYDLSVQSCGKGLNHRLYGITASGYSLKGQSREEAMTIAADTRVIPMGSKVYVDFTEPGYERFSGEYTVRDRGGAIKGKKIDIFMGDFNQYGPSQEAINFGRVQAKVYLK